MTQQNKNYGQRLLECDAVLFGDSQRFEGCSAFTSASGSYSSEPATLKYEDTPIFQNVGKYSPISKKLNLQHRRRTRRKSC
jgi:hypothetical protein